MKLIDADSTIKRVKAQGAEHPNAYPLTHYAELILWEAPAVDAVPVRHGRWLDRKGKVAIKVYFESKVRIFDAYCSECGQWLVGSDEYGCEDNYCPHCGAKMDEENYEIVED